MIRHVLLALPVHLLSATNPPMGTIELIEKYITRFFWSGQESRGKYHWGSWKNLCCPYIEGGTNFRSLSDTCQAFQAKQWWNLRTTNFLWKQFMKAKYFNFGHPSTVQWKKGKAQSWKILAEIKEDVECNIIWKVGKGDVSFWFDNWSRLGPLWQLTPNNDHYSQITIKEVLSNGTWNWNILQPQLNEEMKAKIIDLNIRIDEHKNDRAIWSLDNAGLFSISSAWNMLRQKRTMNNCQLYLAQRHSIQNDVLPDLESDKR